VGSVTIRKSLLVLFLVAGLALVASNLLLARRLGQLQRLDDLLNTSNKLQPGSLVPSLVGYDLAGKKVSYSYGEDSRDTLLLILSPGCHACDENWPNWTRLIQSLNSHDTRLVVANITADPPITSDYIARHGIAGVALIAEMSAESAQAYRLSYTPQTILIGRDGRVRKVYTGMLRDDFFVDLGCATRADCVGGKREAASLSH
jgi:hypothetical protein